MISRVGCILILTSTLAYAQAMPGTNSGLRRDGEYGEKASQTSSADAVGMNDAVLTIKGFCPQQEHAAQPCESIVTRAEFEKMTAAIRPNLSASVKQQFANLYPRLLVMSKKAEELGLDKEVPYEQMIEFSRMQILTQALTRKLEQDPGDVSDQEIAAYYNKNAASYEEYTLERLVVPLHKEGDPSSVNPASQQQFDDLAKTLRKRAAKGEAFAELQQAAFDVAGMKTASPNTAMGKVQLSALPAAHAAVIAQLKVGEVSAVVADPSGRYIYKLQSKGLLPLEQVKGEIQQALESEHAAQALERIQGSYSTETNSAYFAVRPSDHER
jgi:hypothetical protein